MYIAPNSTIKLLTDIPLDPTNDHTIYFANKAAQTAYFDSKAIHVFTEQYYTRHYRGRLRVQVKAEICYNVNYLMFQNTAYGNKWFYAFVTSVNWINNEVTEFVFELDDMQTWFFDYEVEDCFVEREHSLTDRIGENLVPENLEMGDYVYSNEILLQEFQHYKVVCISTIDENLDPATPTQIGGVFTGLKYLTFNTAQQAAAFLYNANNAGKADAVQAVYMVPIDFTILDENDMPYTITKRLSKAYNWTYSFGGKTGVRNKKLYTAPFNQLVCVNQNGQASAMPYEYFDTPNNPDICEFELVGIASPVPEAQIAPRHYKGITTNYNEKMIIQNFPMCAYATDAFRAWLAQNKVTLAIDTAETLLGYSRGIMNTQNEVGEAGAAVLLGSMGAGGGAGGGLGQMDGGQHIIDGIRANASNTLFRVANTLNQVYKASIIPPHARGASNNALGIATKTLGFRLYNAHIRPEFAAIIDDYFDRFGYACHRLKKPNINSRPHWNYVKTIGCTITGTIPGSAANRICSIYDAGITFWKNANEVGNYALNNEPLITGG